MIISLEVPNNKISTRRRRAMRVSQNVFFPLNVVVVVVVVQRVGRTGGSSLGVVILDVGDLFWTLCIFFVVVHPLAARGLVAQVHEEGQANRHCNGVSKGRLATGASPWTQVWERDRHDRKVGGLGG